MSGFSRRDLFKRVSGAVAVSALTPAFQNLTVPDTTAHDGVFTNADIIPDSLIIQIHSDGLQTVQFDTRRTCPKIMSPITVRLKDYGVVFAGRVERTIQRSTTHQTQPLLNTIHARA